MNASPANDRGRILVVGRSPSVLVDTVKILRSKGYSADATNQFDDVLDDYDAQDIGILVFGGMVPAATKQYLRQEIGDRNADVTFVQGLAGIAGLIAAQVEGVITAGEPDDSHAAYDQEQRSLHLTLHKAAHVTVEAWWHTFGDRAVDTAGLYPLAAEALQDVLGDGGDRSQHIRLGKALARRDGWVFAVGSEERREHLRLERTELPDAQGRTHAG